MTEIVKSLSEALATVVESVGPAVVRVEGRRRLPASGIVWSAEGIVVTANHVLERDEDLRVGTPDGEQYSAELLGRDPATDLAALRVEGAELTSADWSEGADLQVGHLVLALGRPGRLPQATLGIVSALGEGWRTAAGGQVDRYLQTDVVMYPGFSGGALADGTGRVLGLNTSALRGVSLALPTATVRRVVESLLAHGRVRRGYLGVGLQPARLPAAMAKQLDQRSALLILSVEPGSAAEQGGLTLGDTILALEGAPIRHMEDLQSALSGDRVGREVTLSILRGGEQQQLKVTVGERP